VIGWRVSEDIKIASYRYRCMIPMRELRRIGVDCRIGVGDVTVFTKHFFPDDPDVARTLKAHGGQVVYDICDDHFNNPKWEKHYRQMCAVADRLVCSSEQLSERVKQETGRESVVITDPYEYPRVLPRKSGAKNVLWFGHSSNLPGLGDEIPRLTDRQVLVVSSLPSAGAKFMEWSREAMFRAFVWADVVIIPVGQTEKKKAKSPNRLVEAVRNGKYVVHNPLKAYEGYGMWSGDIREGLEWADDHPEEVLQAVLKAQELIEQKHSPEAVGKQWMEVLNGDQQLQRPEDESSVVDSPLGSDGGNSGLYHPLRG
jgi:hypothetical protein